MDRFGYAPILFPVAMGGMAVYVSSLNPLRQISITQLDAIYSASLLCGTGQPLHNWGQLGVEGELSKNQITALGLTAANGGYQLFKQVALYDGDFRANFQALAGLAAVEAALTNNPAAIGFYSSARRSAGIRALAIAPLAGEAAVSLDSIYPKRALSPRLQAQRYYQSSSGPQCLSSRTGLS